MWVPGPGACLCDLVAALTHLGLALKLLNELVHRVCAAEGCAGQIQGSLDMFRGKLLQLRAWQQPFWSARSRKRVPNGRVCCTHLLIANVHHCHASLVLFYDLSDLGGGDTRTWRCLGCSGRWVICCHASAGF